MAWYNAATNSFEGSGTLGARNYPSASSASSNSAATAISAVAAFTGTNTGKVYNVGQSYSMNGDAYTAQPDGTFRNTRTGQSLAGSSNSSTATFLAQPSLASGGGSSGGGSGPATPQVVSTGGTADAVRSSGPGNAGAVTSSTAGTGTGPGKPGAVSQLPGTKGGNLKSPFGAGPGTPVVGLPNKLGPDTFYVDPSMPNVEDYWEPRYGEPGEWLGGIANMGADAISWVKSGGPLEFANDRIQQYPNSPGTRATNEVVRLITEHNANNWYTDKVQVPRDGGGWAPKW